MYYMYCNIESTDITLKTQCQKVKKKNQVMIEI